MLRDTAQLLRLYWLLDRREGLKMPVPARILSVILGLALAAFSAFLGYGAGWVLRQPDLPFTLSPGLFPGGILTLMFLAVIIIGVNQALRALFLSGDLERLLATPVSSRAVMVAKLLSRLPSTVLTLFIITYPAFIAFGVGMGLGLLYYLLGIPLVLFAPLFGLSIGALVSMVLVRFIPTNRLNEYLGAASILIGLMFMLVFQLPNLMAGRLDNVQEEQAAAFLQETVETGQTAPLPTLWAGQGLIDVGQGRVTQGLGRMGAYLLLTVGLFAGVVLLTDRLYLSGWLRVQSAGEAKRAPVETATGGVFGRRSLEATLALRDWLLRVREPRHLMNMVMQIAATVIMVFVLARPGSSAPGPMNFLRGDFPAAMPPFLGRLLSPGVLLSGGLVFVSWLLFAQIGTTALALERQSFYILKVAPVGPRDVLRGKALGILTPNLVLMTLLFIGAWFVSRYDLLWAPYGWLSILIITSMIVYFNTAVGFIYPRLDWEDPRRMTTQRGGWYSFIGSLLLIIPALLIALAAFVVAGFFPAAEVIFMLLGLIVLALYGLGMTRFMTRRVERAWVGIG